jgi:hypothetical protein
VYFESTCAEHKIALGCSKVEIFGFESITFCKAQCHFFLMGIMWGEKKNKMQGHSLHPVKHVDNGNTKTGSCLAAASHGPLLPSPLCFTLHFLFALR